MNDEHVEVLVIGGGPAGLAAGRALADHGVAGVLVIDRERQVGGVPRHCHHTGFGMRDLRRVLTGPRYADRLDHLARAAGVRLRSETMVTGWAGPGTVAVTSPAGVGRISARAIVLATGARERPRAARLVPGDRPDGVFTTGQLQQWWHLAGLPVGRSALVVGAEHVSYSAAMTLREAGVRVVGLVTEQPRHQTFGAFAAAMRWGLRVPVWTDTDVLAVRGHGRVRAVDLLHRPSGAQRSLAVDTVVFTGDWLPDSELCRTAGMMMDSRSGGPVVDGAGRTSVEGVFAAGNVVHPGETASVAALRGAATGAAVARLVTDRPFDGARAWTDIVVRPPLEWSAPGRLLSPRDPDAARLPGGLILRSAQFRTHPTVTVDQAGRLLGRYAVREAVPNRPLHVPTTWVADVDAQGGAVTIRLGSPDRHR